MTECHITEKIVSTCQETWDTHRFPVWFWTRGGRWQTQNFPEHSQEGLCQSRLFDLKHDQRVKGDSDSLCFLPCGHHPVLYQSVYAQGTLKTKHPHQPQKLGRVSPEYFMSCPIFSPGKKLLLVNVTQATDSSLYGRFGVSHHIWILVDSLCLLYL